ncbi:hypothetical protein, partial [Mesorhizobium sp.]|uniref:hypothetical protein n=1 Tax=Mesorhizobium sp. TaxID=1871066 RepID=UPI0025F5E5D1
MLQHRGKIGVGRQDPVGQFGAGSSAEEQVLADRRFLVVGARFERNHQSAQPFLFQPGSQRRTQLDDPPGKLRVT